MTCDRPGCTLDAAYGRWRADASKPGVTRSEPGYTQQFLCVAHANEVRMYVGGRLEPVPQPPEDATDENP